MDRSKSARLIAIICTSFVILPLLSRSDLNAIEVTDVPGQSVDSCIDLQQDNDYGSSHENRATGIAIIIGNAGYTDAYGGDLISPRNDAEAMCKHLTKHQYKVYMGIDLELAEIHAIITSSLSELEDLYFMKSTTDAFPSGWENRIVLFYFAGHGFQFRGRNYLIPVDAEKAAIDEFKYEDFFDLQEAVFGEIAASDLRLEYDHEKGYWTKPLSGSGVWL